MGRLFYSPVDSVTAPLGYVTDFATVPRLLRWLVPVDGKHRLAALVHDVCYDYNLMPRKEADRLFLKIMLQDGVRPITAYAMYGVVRIFGKGYTQNDKA
jgi:hypothetical protein